MDTAISRSGSKIRAKDAHRGDDFLCPECLIKVIYAAGPTQTPHFKHFPRSPAESARIKTCQFYVAEQEGYDWGSAPYIAERLSSPRSRLAFTWAGKDLDRQRWALLVTIPTPPPSVSFLHVDENLNGGVDFPRALALCSTLGLGQDSLCPVSSYWVRRIPLPGVAPGTYGPAADRPAKRL